MSFIYNFHSEKSHLEQWNKYLEGYQQTQDIVKAVSVGSRKISKSVKSSEVKITQTLNAQKKVIEHTIGKASDDITKEIQFSTDAICGSLDAGFKVMSSNLTELSSSIDRIGEELEYMSTMLDWRLSSLIEEQRLANVKLDKIAEAVKIPEFQKVRIWNVKRALVYLKSARTDSSHYLTAIKHFSTALVEDDEDYFSMYELGMIFLFVPQHLDVGKAKDLFVQSANHARADGKSYKDGDNENEFCDPNILKVEAAYMAAKAAYVLGAFNEAAKLSQQVVKHKTNHIGGRLLCAKSYVAGNNGVRAATAIRSLIKNRWMHVIFVLDELDLIGNPEVRAVINEEKEESHSLALKIVKNCRKRIISGSVADKELSGFESRLDVNTIYENRQILEELAKKQKRTFRDVRFDNHLSSSADTEAIIKSWERLKPLVDNPESWGRNYDAIWNLSKKLSKNTQWNFGHKRTWNCYGFENVYISPKENYSTLLDFIVTEAKYSKQFASAVTSIETTVADVRTKEERLQAPIQKNNQAKALKNQALYASVIFGVVMGIVFLFFFSLLISLLIGIVAGVSFYQLALYNDGN